MSPKEILYAPLKTDEDSESFEGPTNPARRTSDRRWIRLWLLLTTSLLVSICVNALTLSRLALGRDRRGGKLGGVSAAGLAWDVHTVFDVKHSPWKNTDRKAQDEAWNAELILPRRLAVQLADSYAEGELGLLHSMRWPWNEHHGVYIPQVGHQIHCLHWLRHTVNGYFDEIPPSDMVKEGFTYEHTLHCLDMLLQDVMCYADDDLLYTGWLHDNTREPPEDTIPGTGTERICRDFSKLRAWSDENSACFWPGYQADNASVTESDRYKFCPDDRRPWEGL